MQEVYSKMHISSTTKMMLIPIAIILFGCWGGELPGADENDAGGHEPDHQISISGLPSSLLGEPSNGDEDTDVGDTDTDTVSDLQLCYDVPQQLSYHLGDAWMSGGHLTVSVSYTGGCEEHEFPLCWDGTWEDADEPVVHLTLGHLDGGEMCEAIVQPVYLDYDISLLAESDYLDSEDEINIYIADMLTVVGPVVYEF